MTTEPPSPACDHTEGWHYDYDFNVPLLIEHRWCERCDERFERTLYPDSRREAEFESLYNDWKAKEADGEVWEVCLDVVESESGDGYAMVNLRVAEEQGAPYEIKNEAVFHFND